MSQPIADDASGQTRRSFLNRSALTAAAVVPAAILAAARRPAPRASPGSPSSTRPERPELPEIQRDENTHVATLIAALGSNARPEPTFQGIDVRGNFNLFVSYSYAFENTGVGAYLGALPYVNNKSYLTAAGEIALVEAYHSGCSTRWSTSPSSPGISRSRPPSPSPQVIANAVISSPASTAARPPRSARPRPTRTTSRSSTSPSCSNTSSATSITSTSRTSSLIDASKPGLPRVGSGRRSRGPRATVLLSRSSDAPTCVAPHPDRSD